MSGKRLSAIELSILDEVKGGQQFKPNTKYEEQLAAGLQVHGYLDSSFRITQLGRGALKGQGGQ